MKTTIITIYFLAITMSLWAQSGIESVLSDIESNNTTLAVLKKKLDADKLENKTGLLPSNPEVAFGYLWGDPSSMGIRKDLSVSEAFDFPTAYAHRNKIANYKNHQAELEYEKHRRDILLEAKLLCLDLIYTNAIKAELEKQVSSAQTIADSYKRKFELGDVGVLDYNKASLNLLNTQSELKQVNIELGELNARLTLLNGGKEINLDSKSFETPVLASNYEEWYAQAEQNNPVLQWLKQENEIAQQEVKLKSAMSLPKIEAGYMSESVVGESFRGITVGLSIPLWENKNEVKHAKAKALVSQQETEDHKLQFSNQLKMLYTKASELQKNVTEYSENFMAINDTKLLLKALESGEISLIEYTQEVSFYFDSSKHLLDMQKELHQTIALLNQYR